MPNTNRSARGWEADPSAEIVRRIGRPLRELPLDPNDPGGDTGSAGEDGCPDLLEVANGDYLGIGRDVTDQYRDRLPTGVSLAADERIVAFPRVTILAAKEDIPDA